MERLTFPPRELTRGDGILHSHKIKSSESMNTRILEEKKRGRGKENRGEEEKKKQVERWKEGTMGKGEEEGKWERKRKHGH